MIKKEVIEIMNNSRYYRMQQNMEDSNGLMGNVRILHAVPDAPNVDIYADDALIANDLAYGEYTDYLELPEGKHKIELFVAGTINEPVLKNVLTVVGDTYLTVAATGTLDNMGFVGIVDADMIMNPGKAMIRFAHLSPDAPAVDITLQNGTVIFQDVSFKEITSYLDVLPMDYTLQVRVAGTETTVLTVPNVNVEEGNFYTVYAIGLVEEEPELEALLLVDENS
jgi:hypothetical protein